MSKITRLNRQRIVRIIRCSFSCNYVLFRKEERNTTLEGSELLIDASTNIQNFVIINDIDDNDITISMIA